MSEQATASPSQPQYVAQNTNEEVVELYLDDCITKSGMCGCSRCRADVLAFALNQLPPHYIVTKIGYVYSRLQSMKPQNQADIVTAIMKGIQLVKDHPHHE